MNVELSKTKSFGFLLSVYLDKVEHKDLSHDRICFNNKVNLEKRELVWKSNFGKLLIRIHRFSNLIFRSKLLCVEYDQTK